MDIPLQERIKKEIKEIVKTWNDDGIIFESQFEFASSFLLKRSDLYKKAYKIITENGGDVITSMDTVLCTAVKVSNDGWYYAMFNPDRLELCDVQNKIIEHFSK